MTFFRELVARLRSKRGRTETASVSLDVVIEEGLKDPEFRRGYEAERALIERSRNQRA